MLGMQPHPPQELQSSTRRLSRPNANPVLRTTAQRPQDALAGPRTEQGNKGVQGLPTVAMYTAGGPQPSQRPAQANGRAGAPLSVTPTPQQQNEDSDGEGYDMDGIPPPATLPSKGPQRHYPALTLPQQQQQQARRESGSYAPIGTRHDATFRGQNERNGQVGAQQSYSAAIIQGAASASLSPQQQHRKSRNVWSNSPTVNTGSRHARPAPNQQPQPSGTTLPQVQGRTAQPRATPVVNSMARVDNGIVPQDAPARVNSHSPERPGNAAVTTTAAAVATADVDGNEEPNLGQQSPWNMGALSTFGIVPDDPPLVNEMDGNAARAPGKEEEEDESVELQASVNFANGHTRTPRHRRVLENRRSRRSQAVAVGGGNEPRSSVPSAEAAGGVYPSLYNVMSSDAAHPSQKRPTAKMSSNNSFGMAREYFSQYRDMGVGQSPVQSTYNLKERTAALQRRQSSRVDGGAGSNTLASHNTSPFNYSFGGSFGNLLDNDVPASEALGNLRSNPGSADNGNGPPSANMSVDDLYGVIAQVNSLYYAPESFRDDDAHLNEIHGVGVGVSGGGGGGGYKESHGATGAGADGLENGLGAMESFFRGPKSDSDDEEDFLANVKNGMATKKEDSLSIHSQSPSRGAGAKGSKQGGKHRDEGGDDDDTDSEETSDQDEENGVARLPTFRWMPLASRDATTAAAANDDDTTKRRPPTSPSSAHAKDKAGESREGDGGNSCSNENSVSARRKLLLAEDRRRRKFDARNDGRNAHRKKAEENGELLPDDSPEEDDDEEEQEAMAETFRFGAGPATNTVARAYERHKQELEDDGRRNGYAPCTTTTYGARISLPRPLHGSDTSSINSSESDDPDSFNSRRDVHQARPFVDIFAGRPRQNRGPQPWWSEGHTPHVLNPFRSDLPYQRTQNYQKVHLLLGLDPVRDIPWVGSPPGVDLETPTAIHPAHSPTPLMARMMGPVVFPNGQIAPSGSAMAFPFPQVNGNQNRPWSFS